MKTAQFPLSGFRIAIRATVISILLAITTMPFHVLYAQDLFQKADSLIRAAFPDQSGPGSIFTIARQGKIIYQKATGKANLELGTDITAGNVFELGSMTKQFTAIAVLMLEERGKLKTTDPVSRYIPGYPAGDRITLHHLLTHTSGIKNFTEMKTLSTIAQKEMTPNMLVDFFKNEPVDFAPGEKFKYCNSGYVLLGYIIELVSGETYKDFIEKNIFSPAGMRDSYYASDRQVIPRRAYGYHKKADGYVNKTRISFSIPFSAGALMSTTGDMLKWQNALDQNLLLRPATILKAFTSYQLNDGTDIAYGYGWHIKRINGLTTREHGGSIFGFKTMGIYIPAKALYIVGLSNCDCNSPTKTTEALAMLALQALEIQNKTSPAGTDNHRLKNE